ATVTGVQTCARPIWKIIGRGAYRLRNAEPTKRKKGFLERRPMRKIIAGTLFVALTGTLAVAAPRQDRDDRRDRGEKHDNGRHEEIGRASCRRRLWCA